MLFILIDFLIIPESSSWLSISPSTTTESDNISNYSHKLLNKNMITESENIQVISIMKEASTEIYTSTISDWIYKFALQLIKSNQNITKLKSLLALLSNILKNKQNSKDSSDEMRFMIKNDRHLPEKVTNLMNTFQIINIDFKSTKVQYLN